VDGAGLAERRQRAAQAIVVADARAIAAIPVPGSLARLLSGVAALGLAKRRRAAAA
jgi:hypothetical protein